MRAHTRAKRNRSMVDGEALLSEARAGRVKYGEDKLVARQGRALENFFIHKLGRKEHTW